ncbi:MAG: RagB/SusD family nutrient uptake outer membrane protein, partial [Balneolaceae bacterium]
YIVMAGGGAWGSHNGLWSMHEVATDEAIIPQRGQDWFDGGIWLRQHRHTFTFEEGFINGSWSLLFQGVNAANRLIFQLDELEQQGVIDRAAADEFISELRALRAFYYFWLLDSFGNVPIIDDFATAPANPANNPNFQQGRTELFNFVESELLNAVNFVTDEVSGNTRGRLTKFGVHFLLGKLYLNAQVYTGTPRWQDAVDQFDIIIDSGNFSLVGNYFANFAVDNSGSPENIFVIPYDNVFLPGFNLNQMSLHYGQQFEFDLQDQPWNGYATTQSFYEKFEESDDRREGFLTGPRFRSDGGPVLDPDFGLCPRFEDDRREAEQHLVLQVRINQLEPCAGRENGARFAKFEIQAGETPNKSNDFPVMRYADVLLSKAEALFRLGNTEDALQYVNTIRNRSGLDGFNNLTSQNLLDERGRELYLEMWRRQDMIRFPGQNGGVTAFNDPWDFKEVSPAFRNVFPIPRDQMQANPNLNQNPGY